MEFGKTQDLYLVSPEGFWHTTFGGSSSKIDSVNSLRPGQDGRHFADDIFKCVFLNENVRIPIKISLKFVPNGLINNIPALV